MSKEVFRPRREVNKIAKKGKPRDVHVGIFIPLPYYAASSSLALQMLYEYINNLQDAIAYRFVYNIDEDEVEALDQNISLRDLDLVLVSASFELDYINIAHVLNSLKLLPRKRDKRKPFIVIGGLAASANPLPLSKIADAVVIGEVEDVLEDIVYSAQEDDPRKVLEDIKCVWIPYFKEFNVERCIVKDLDQSFHPVKQVYSIDEEPVFGYGLRVELSRGCPYLCPFCMESHLMYPFRIRSYNTVWRIIDKGLNSIPIMRRTIFYSLSFFSVHYADQLLDKLLNEGVQASIPSLRPEHLTKQRLEVMYELGQKTITVAPETLVEAFGCRIGKCLNIDDLVDNVLNAYAIGYNHVKLYLITGFPNLNIEEEINALRKFLDKLEKYVKKRKFIEISLNILVPKPWTPYQNLPPYHVIENSYRVKVFKSLVKQYGFVSMDIMDPKWGFAQAVIAQGDKRISEIIEQCSAEKCSLSKFLNMVNSNINELRFIVNGWGGEPPWTQAINIGFNPIYLNYRFKYLTKT